MNWSFLALGAASVVAVLGWAGEAQAVTATRYYWSHGTANCQSALPVFDGNVRKRPMAVANEGTSLAFITCDTESIDDAGRGFISVRVIFRNRAGANGVTVNCALVDGVVTAGASFPRSTPGIPAGGTDLIQWNPTDNGGNEFYAPAISCGLPPGVDISVVRYTYAEDVGA